MYLKFLCEGNEKITLKHNETWIFPSSKRVLKLRDSVVRPGEPGSRNSEGAGNGAPHGNARGLSCPASSRADGTHGASTGGRVGDEESRPCLPRTPTHVAR